MKYFYLIIFIIFSFIYFSCKGTPASDEHLPYQYLSDETADDITDSFVEEDSLWITEEYPILESMEVSQIEEDNETLDDMIPFDILTEAVAEDEEPEEQEILTEIAAEESQIEEPQEIFEITQTPEEPFEEILEEPPVEITQAMPEPQIQEQLPVQVSPPSPVQEQPPEQTQPPVQAQSPTPSQIQPPVQTPPPAQPPALLGPAEETWPLERQSVSGETPRDSAQVETPVQTVTTPQSSQSVQSSPQTSDSGEIFFSRVVRATVGQIIEIPFRGTGWVYLGELASRRGIAYDSRRLDNDGQSFIFRTEEAGTYALKFFRQDFIRDYILNDHVQVIVGEAPDAAGAGWFNPPVDRGRVIAQPRWPSALEEAELQRGGSISSLGATQVDSSDGQPSTAAPDTPASSDTAPSSAQQGAAATTAPATSATTSSQGVNGAPLSSDGIASLFTPPSDALLSATPPSAEQLNSVAQPESAESVSPDILIQRAKENFDAGNVSAAIALLDQYSQYYPSGTDELYWLYGQFYEANTPSRNILLSLDYYQRLVNEFPQSSRYNDARGRITYLERFYIHIR